MLRYRVKGEPMRVTVCYCTFCQRRTGSACGIAVFFAEQNVEMTGEDLAVYEYISDESKMKLALQFCRRCGTKISGKLERFPNGRVIFGGTFDEPNWLRVARQMWTRSAQRWMVLPENIPCFEKSSLG